MKSFTLFRKSVIDRDVIFQISTNVKNFHDVMLNYFKSLNVLEDNGSQKIVLEKISFLGKTHDVKTKHIVLSPNLHGVFILSGPLKNTSFVEHYESSVNGTDITISVSLEINGFLKLIPLVDILIKKKMSLAMNQFIHCAEDYSERIMVLE